MSEKKAGECPNHPLHRDPEFRDWVYRAARDTDPREMVEDDHFVAGLLHDIAHGKATRRNPSSYYEPDTAGGVMLLHREYEAVSPNGESEVRDE